MQTLIQTSPEELLSLIRAAVREELKVISPGGSDHGDSKSLNKKEAADFLRVSTTTLDRLIKSSQLSAFNIGSKVFVRVRDLEAYINNKG